MARIRTIKPAFWDDSKIAKLSRDARLLYIGMWSFCDDIGVVIGESIWLKSKVFPYYQIQIQQFEKWVTELVKNGFIYLLSYHEERFIYLPNFTRHQVINRANLSDLNIPKELIDNILPSITEQSLNNHGTIIDVSLTIKGKDILSSSSSSSLRYEDNSDDLSKFHFDEEEEKKGARDVKIDFQKFVEFWNRTMDEAHSLVPHIRTIDGERRKRLTARARENGKESIFEMVKKVSQSDFLNGKNNKGWMASFSWAILPRNFLKIIEGTYDNRNKTNANYQERRTDDKRRGVEAGGRTVQDFESDF